MIRGYHIYRSVWEAVVGELKCAKEIGNPSDPYAVAVMRATPQATTYVATATPKTRTVKNWRTKTLADEKKFAKFLLL